MTRDALIGYTGFVGSNLCAQHKYTDFFNSMNYRDMRGQSFHHATCVGISAAKWLANGEPEQDWDKIQKLLDVLETVSVKRFVLISTIDVYPDPSQPLDEGAQLEGLPNHAYGRHRLAVERWVADRFSDHVVVRLPALFGPNLKKNALFDLLNAHEAHKINPASSFQWYPVQRLGGHLETIERLSLRLVNLFTEPVPMRDIVEDMFPNTPIGQFARSAPTYKVKTRHAELFGGENGYIMDANAVITAMRAHVAHVRTRCAQPLAG